MGRGAASDGVRCSGGRARHGEGQARGGAERWKRHRGGVVGPVCWAGPRRHVSRWDGQLCTFLKFHGFGIYQMTHNDTMQGEMGNKREVPRK
jgi:hypothetical protein